MIIWTCFWCHYFHQAPFEEKYRHYFDFQRRTGQLPLQKEVQLECLGNCCRIVHSYCSIYSFQTYSILNYRVRRWIIEVPCTVMVLFSCQFPWISWRYYLDCSSLVSLYKSFNIFSSRSFSWKEEGEGFDLEEQSNSFLFSLIFILWDTDARAPLQVTCSKACCWHAI